MGSVCFQKIHGAKELIIKPQNFEQGIWNIEGENSTSSFDMPYSIFDSNFLESWDTILQPSYQPCNDNSLDL